jgi:carboxyl-terminal processing protease
MSRLAKVVILTLSLVVFSYVSLGYVLARTGNDDKAYRSLGVYGEVLQRIEQDYVDDPNMAQVTAGALHGLLESLDPLSSYMSPREYAEYKQKAASGAKGETGVALSKRFGYVIVISVLPDSPAQKVGIRSGDVLEAIAGFTTREMSVGQAMQLLAGEPGTSVKVSVVRRGNSRPLDADLVRAQMGPSHLLVDKADQDVAYLRVPALDAGKADEIREKLLQFDKQGLHKLVLDLRDCARGEISEGVAVARLFLNSGTIATLKGQTVTRQEFAADPSKVVWKYPVEVLISNSTSGAAEIVAAGIGGNKRGDLVGERTFGTASEQKMIPFEDGAAIVLTVANYYTPAGKSIPDEGVAPTQEVRSPIEDQDDASDDGTPAPLNSQPAMKYPSPDDPVLHRAIELLKNEMPRKVALRHLPTTALFAVLNALPA